MRKSLNTHFWTYSILLRYRALENNHTNGKLFNIVTKQLFVKILVPSKHKKLLSAINVLNKFAADLQILLTWRVKLSLSSKWKARSLAKYTASIIWLSGVKVSFDYSFFHMSIIIAWNLSVFTIILLSHIFSKERFW